MIPLFRELIVELHSDCNRDCYFCSRHSDTSGHRKTADGKRVRQSMPSEMIEKVLLDAHHMGYTGLVTFHHFSEPFLDSRLIEFARRARGLGMRPFDHTNGDVLRNNPELCAEAREVFEYLVVGLYDCKTQEGRGREVAFWRERLGNQVRFSPSEKMVARSHYTKKNLDGYEASQGRRPKTPTHPRRRCIRPPLRMMVHYTGNMALCCEDMAEEFDLGSVYDRSLAELWYSERHVEIVNHLETGPREKYRLCRNCPLPP